MAMVTERVSPHRTSTLVRDYNIFMAKGWKRHPQYTNGHEKMNLSRRQIGCVLETLVYRN